MTAETPPAVVAALGAVNSGDTQQFLDCFTEDGSVNDWGRVYSGRQAIRRWSDREFTGVDVSLAVIEQSTSGDTTVIRALVGGSGFNGESTFSFTTDGNAIRTMRITA
jgi:SnoaL-like domain